MANHSQRILLALRSRVRSSSKQQMREMQGAEATLVQGLGVLTSSQEPGGDRRLPVAEDPLRCRSIQCFGQSRKHLGDLLGWRFQAVQWGVAPGSEGGQAWQRKVWMRSVWPCLPSPTSAWMSASVIPKYKHC